MPLSAKDIQNLIDGSPKGPRSSTCIDCSGVVSSGRVLCEGCEAAAAMQQLRRLADADPHSYGAALVAAEAALKA